LSAWTISDSSLAATAAARRHTFALRALHNAIFALGLGLVTGAPVVLIACYAVVIGLMAGDAWAGKAFVNAVGARKAVLRVVFLASSVGTIIAFMGMALFGALYGGPEGRIAATLMAAGSLVTVMVTMVEVPAFMVVSALPGAIVLALLPLLSGPPPVGLLSASVGHYLVMGAFMSRLVQTGFQYVKLVGGLRESRVDAESRRREADDRRIEAETHRREAEKANSVKSEFLCAMTHEFRTPLNAVINYGEMIEEESDGAVARDARSITRSAKHLLALIERILDFSTIDTGRFSLSNEEFDLRQAVDEVVAANLPAVQANGNSISVVNDGVAAVWADRARLMQCIDCLVSNAAKFTKDGMITVTLSQTEMAFSVTVSDTGEGLSEEALGSVFGAFTQADGSKTRAVNGLGLGLATALGVARAMGGEILVQSALGSGSRFEFRAPLALAAPVQQNPALAA
jgi:signal transduction histidine kinase